MTSVDPQPPSATEPRGHIRIAGKIVTGLDEPVLTMITLRPQIDGRNGTNVAQTIQSFANGDFRFEGVGLGNYVVEIVDPRFRLYHDTILLRDEEDAQKRLFVRLVKLGEPEGTPRLSAELYTIDAATQASVTAKALDAYNKGVSAIRNPDRANQPEAHFRRAIAAAPRFFEAHLLLGLQLRQQEKYSEALEQVELAAGLKPQDGRTAGPLGEMYCETQQFQKAADILSKLAAAGKMQARRHYCLGTAFYRLDRLNEAVEQLQLAIEVGNQADPEPYLQLHNVLTRRREGLLALDVLERYLKLFPGDPNHAAMSQRAEQMRKTFRPPGV